MRTRSPFVRLFALSGEQRLLFVRAAVILTTVSAAVALLPFRRAIRLGSSRLRVSRAIPIADVLWAVEAVARRLPLRAVCIEKGLAVQWLLRSSGIDARLHYGAKHDASGALEAHVWVTVDGKAIIGGEQAIGFREIAAFP